MLTRRAALVLVFAIAWVAHLPALQNGFVLDDRALLVENPYVRDEAGLPTLLTGELFGASGEVRQAPYYRPLSGALAWLSYRLVGASAPLQHALNPLAHAALAMALCVGFTRRGVGVAGALMASALFAIHPATPEVVAYLGGRQEMLGWLIVLGAWAWLGGARARPVTWFSVALVATVAASLSHELFLLSPLLLLPAAVSAPDRRGKLALSLGAGGALGVGAVLALRQALRIQSVELSMPGWGEALGRAAGLLLRLGQVSLLPRDVAFETTSLRLGLLAGAGLFLSVVAVAVLTTRWLWQKSRERATLALFGWAVLAVSVVMHMPAVLKYQVVADRYAYSVVLGLASILAAFWGQVSLRVPVRATWLRAIAVAVVLAPIPLTWARAAEWHDEPSLQAAMYRTHPEDPHAWLAEGMRLFAAGRYDEAYPLCREYTDARPDSDRAGWCLGKILMRRGKPQEAARVLEHYVFARPGIGVARVTLFRAWFATDDLAGVRRGLGYYRGLGLSFPDLDAARRELERRGTSP